MKTKNIFLVAAMLLSILHLPSSILHAQAPQSFKYQSIIRNAAGNPLATTTVTVRATVHDASATGTVVYQETHAATTNQFGLINLEIGTGTVVSGTFSSIAWGTASKWMEIEANFGAGYLAMGTSQLLSVPYALYSNNGTPGATGPTGSAGPSGNIGAQGTTGVTGPQGIAGTTGTQGPTGSVGATGAQGTTGPQGIAGTTGSQGPTGTMSNGAAQFIRTIQTPNNSVPPGTAFTIDTQVFNSAGSGITASAGNGGTVFTLANAGTYVVDYELSLNSAGSVGLYTGASAGTLVLDNNSISGSSTATTWIHGRSFVTVTSSPTLIELSSVVGTADISTAGSAAGFFMIRLTIVKVL